MPGELSGDHVLLLFWVWPRWKDIIILEDFQKNLVLSPPVATSGGFSLPQRTCTSGKVVLLRATMREDILRNLSSQFDSPANGPYPSTVDIPSDQLSEVP